MQNSQNMALLEPSRSPLMVDASSLSAHASQLAIANGTLISPEAQVLSSGIDHIVNTDQISLYVVRTGDTLPAVAKMFGVTTNTIRWGNNLKGNSLAVGQTLVILPISGIEHVVKSGETLQSIARLHKGDITDILQYNNLTLDSKLTIGDVVMVPDGEASAIQSGHQTNTKTVGSASKLNKNSLNNSLNMGISVAVSNSTPATDGYYLRPIVGGIKTQGIHGHNGVDLASAYGANILAAASGEVIISRDSGWNGGYGSYVVLKHDNGTQTLYGHLSATDVSVGEHVSRGQIIGRMGSSGESTGTHLHFEIRGAVNPF